MSFCGHRRGPAAALLLASVYEGLQSILRDSPSSVHVHRFKCFVLDPVVQMLPASVCSDLPLLPLSLCCAVAFALSCLFRICPGFSGSCFPGSAAASFCVPPDFPADKGKVLSPSLFFRIWFRGIYAPFVFYHSGYFRRWLCPCLGPGSAAASFFCSGIFRNAEPLPLRGFAFFEIF